MFLIDVIKVMWYERQIYKFEEANTFSCKSKKNRSKFKLETKKSRAARLAMEEEKRKQMIKESNERLALLFLSECVGDEDSMNKACDLIKRMGLVEGYE